MRITTMILAIFIVVGVLIFALLSFRNYEYTTFVPYEYRLCADEAYNVDKIDVANDYIESTVRIFHDRITITDYYSNKSEYGAVIRNGKIKQNRAVFEDCDFPELFMIMDRSGDIECLVNEKPFMYFYSR